MPATARLLFRKDTTANWMAANPILLDGEMGIEVTVDGNIMFKVGDGVANAQGVVTGSHWLDLPYISGPEGKPPAHQWDGTNLKFRNPDGQWGLSVNLKGERGVKGDKGDQGIQGPVGPPYKLPPATKTLLGGIKVGKNLTITLDGCLSAPDPFYVPMLGVIAYRGGIGGSDGRRPVYWDGTVNEDWVLCDGITTNGIPVPNLRDKFIVGAGHLYDILSEGGSLSHVHGMFITDQGNKPEDGYVKNWDTRYTGQTTLMAYQMPQHSHNIFMGKGWMWDAGNPTKGSGAAWCDPKYTLPTNWNRAPGSSKLITGVTPDPGTAQGSPTSRTGYEHQHYMHKQNTEPATSLPPYYSLIYLMRIH